LNWKRSRKRLPDEDLSPLQYRLAFVSIAAAAIGAITGVIAFALYDLIDLITNISFYDVWSFHFRSPQQSLLGPWLILVPVVGAPYIVLGLLCGLAAVGFAPAREKLEEFFGLKRIPTVFQPAQAGLALDRQ
jgi:H+/Cl- antiporter ClcA